EVTGHSLTDEREDLAGEVADGIPIGGGIEQDAADEEDVPAFFEGSRSGVGFDDVTQDMDGGGAIFEELGFFQFGDGGDDVGGFDERDFGIDELIFLGFGGRFAVQLLEFEI